MLTITSGELQNNVARYRLLAQKAPVSVKHYGRESIVLISADEYRRLKSLDTRETFVSINLSDGAIAELEKGIVRNDTGRS